ncbi:hypothetical protein H6P81_015831 [Aristolochia fimbriata]|uniref:Aminotransferase-like plant mobile domain-containing protein n=1 Tax=Aristolochia fimbriata TaxID=158543 RepID=A0AAV7E9J1_ARIFI|nr:hypothetical protein H6P81_015831 [Aristolochia fimbriata]
MLNSPSCYAQAGHRALENPVCSPPMSSPSDSASFLGLVLSNVQATGDRRPLLLPLWRPSAFGGCDVHVPLVKATCEFWSHPVVNEDDQICYLPGVGEASSSPHQTQGTFLLSPMHDTGAFLYTRTFHRPQSGVQPSEDPWADRKKTFGLTSRDRSPRLNQPLVELGVPDALADEVYLAAFLSLWICRCILPMPGGMLRFTVFKMACYLASDQKCNLAVVTLASLYRGLNSSTCGRIPWSFVYTWLAQRFGVHGVDPSEGERPLMIIYRNPDRCLAYTKKEAHELFWRGGVRCWYPSQALPPGPIVDKTGHYASRIEVEYFRCLRATHLVLQQRDLLIVEPYSPHRFARQFGFCQDLPGILMGDQRRAASVEALVEIWQAGSVFPIGTVEVPPFVSPSFDPGVTALFRESWLETIVPLFEWQNFTGESAPKKKTMPKRATTGSKAAKKTANTPTPEMPTQGVVIRETPPVADVSQPSSISSPTEGASVDKGKRVVEPVASQKKAAPRRKKAETPRTLTPLRNVHPPTVPAPESREKVLEVSPVNGSVAPSVEETAVEQRAMPVHPLPIRSWVAEESPCPPADTLAIVLSPRVDQPTLRAKDSLSPVVSGEHRQLGWVGGEARVAAVVGRLKTGEAECPMTILSDNEASSHPSVGAAGVEFSSPASDVGRPATTTPEERPFTRNRSGTDGVTLDVGEGGLQLGRRPVSENSSTLRFVSSSLLPLSARSREWVQQSALGLWTRFVWSILAPTEEPCSPKLVADARGFLEHLRAGVETSILEQWVEDFAREADHLQQLHDFRAEKLSRSERHIVEAEIAQSIRRVNCRRDAMTATLDQCEVERETTESECAAIRERLAVVEVRLDSAAARIASARTELDAIEGEASVLEGAA